tara:strand:- start:6969 stop:7184 length:216 start_codon:yes stop_codon:yes gene_type:complete
LILSIEVKISYLESDRRLFRVASARGGRTEGKKVGPNVKKTGSGRFLVNGPSGAPAQQEQFFNRLKKIKMT